MLMSLGCVDFYSQIVIFSVSPLRTGVFLLMTSDGNTKPLWVEMSVLGISMSISHWLPFLFMYFVIYMKYNKYVEKTRMYNKDMHVANRLTSTVLMQKTSYFMYII